MRHAACWTVVLWCAVAATPTEVTAQEKTKPIVYQPAGAPSNPKVPARWNRYHSHAEATKLLQDLTKAYPKLCKLQSLGKSYGKRDMW